MLAKLKTQVFSEMQTTPKALKTFTFAKVEMFAYLQFCDPKEKLYQINGDIWVVTLVVA